MQESIAASISTDTLDRIRKLGCPEIKIPGTEKVVFDPDEVVAWLKEQSKPVETASEKEASQELDSILNNREHS